MQPLSPKLHLSNRVGLQIQPPIRIFRQTGGPADNSYFVAYFEVSQRGYTLLASPAPNCREQQDAIPVDLANKSTIGIEVEAAVEVGEKAKGYIDEFIYEIE